MILEATPATTRRAGGPVRSRYVASGLALAYSLALLGDNMMYAFLPSHPGAAGIAVATIFSTASATGASSRPRALS